MVFLGTRVMVLTSTSISLRTTCFCMTVQVTVTGHGGVAGHGLAHGSSQPRFLAQQRPKRPWPPLFAQGAGGVIVRVTWTGTHTVSQTTRFCFVKTGTQS